jgi:hypothetical protein
MRSVLFFITIVLGCCLVQGAEYKHQACSAHFDLSSHLVVERFVDRDTFLDGVFVRNPLFSVDVKILPDTEEENVILSSGIIPKDEGEAIAFVARYSKGNILLDSWHYHDDEWYVETSTSQEGKCFNSSSYSQSLVLSFTSIIRSLTFSLPKLFSSSSFSLSLLFSLSSFLLFNDINITFVDQ